jgi:hypothetical protein
MQYGPNCNYKHEGPQGGKKRGADAAALLTSGGSKKSRRKLVSLLVKDFRENLKRLMHQEEGSTTTGMMTMIGFMSSSGGHLHVS